MPGLVTNFWTAVGPGPSGEPVSSVVLESTHPPAAWALRRYDALELELEASGLGLNFPPTRVPVLDGLVREVAVEHRGDGVVLTVWLEHPCAPNLGATGTGPYRSTCWFDRSPLRAIVQGVTVLVDPGHGGRDNGARGPINLVEKDVTLRLARYLVAELRSWGARPLVTRHGDRDLPAGARFLAARQGEADLVVSLHADGLPDPEARGVRTWWWTSHPGSEDLARHIHRSLLERTGFPDRGVHRSAPPDPRLRVPGVTVEPVAISNLLDEAWLRSSTFLARAARAITRGLTAYLATAGGRAPACPGEGGRGAAARAGASAPPSPSPRPVHPTAPYPGAAGHVPPLRGAAAGPPRPPEGKAAGAAVAAFHAVPVRTHLLTPEDDMVEVVARYTRGVAEPGDVICVAESPLAVTQGRAIPSSQVKAGLAARLLSRFPDPDGSLGTPQAMQLAIAEVGLGRILLGGVAAALGRAAGRRGDFFRVAGQQVALIDDIAGTMPPYDRHVVLGPRDPDRVVQAIRRATGVDALVADVNDLRCVDILASTASYPEALLVEALRDNPFGNDDQCTPIVVLKPVRRER